MHPKLIQANLALFHEHYSETRRLLAEYQQEQIGLPEPERSLVLWLEAHTHTNRDERLQSLRLLVNSVAANDIYARMARSYLAEEAHYSAPSPNRRSQFLLPGLTLLGIVLLVIVVVLGRQSPLPAGDSESQPVASVDNQPELPDFSQPLTLESYTYPRGIVQFTAFEDNSQRVLRLEDARLVEPVPGARFYALKLVFECRSGICDQPPQADILLRMDDGVLIPTRADLGISGERALQAIAQGRTSTGWLVYEIPIVSAVDGAEIHYEEDIPHFIGLPAALER